MSQSAGTRVAGGAANEVVMKYTTHFLAVALLTGCGADPQVQEADISGSVPIGSNAELVATVNFDKATSWGDHRIPLSWAPHGDVLYAGIKVPQQYEDGRYLFMAQMPGDEKTLVTVEQILLDAQLHEVKRSRGTLNAPGEVVGWVSGVPLFVDHMQKGTYYLLVRDVDGRPLSLEIRAGAAEPLPPFDPDLPPDEPPPPDQPDFPPDEDW